MPNVSQQKNKPNIWAIVPGAGIGKRMQSEKPKQYLLLNSKTVIEHSITTLLKNQSICAVVVALNKNDHYWQQLNIKTTKPVYTVAGGKERADSVLNALSFLFEQPDFNHDTDWVMVHDAVRPCLQQKDINQLIEQVAGDENGGLLALPVRDTMKRQKSLAQCVASTIEREHLWHALTPQYFPAKRLKQALENAQKKKLNMTDESSAMEFLGYAPRLIQGYEDNIKITRPDDLRLANLYLTSSS